MRKQASRRREVALVTGGAVRIGQAIVDRLAQEGYAVAVHSHRSRFKAEALARRIRARGGSAAVVVGDLSVGEDVARLVPDAEKALGPVTLLVNNASVFEPDEVTALLEQRWETHFAVNLKAPVFLAYQMAAALPIRLTGAIINILDQQVLKPTPHFFSYTLTKAALHMATITMAQALAPRIRVNGVAPGPTLKAQRQSTRNFAKQRAAVPLGHGSDPDDIVEAVLYLARAKSVTGQVIAVDGGQHIAWKTPDVIELKP